MLRDGKNWKSVSNEALTIAYSSGPQTKRERNSREMDMALKTATVNSGQNVQNWRKGRPFAEATKKLSEENKFVKRGEEARRNCVEIVNKFVSKLSHGEKEKAREALCKEAGIARRTFTRWQTEMEQRNEVGQSVFEKAEVMGYELTPLSIKNLADAKRLNPGKSPEEIVKKAMDVDASPKPKEERVQEPETTPTQLLEDTVVKYLQDTNDDYAGLVEVLKCQVPVAELCAAMKGFKCP
jgi:hypothetical protein